MTDFPNRAPKAQASRGVRGHAPPGRFLDFNSLKSSCLGFRVLQTEYWLDFNLESFFTIKNIVYYLLTLCFSWYSDEINAFEDALELEVLKPKTNGAKKKTKTKTFHQPALRVPKLRLQYIFLRKPVVLTLDCSQSPIFPWDR